MLNVEVRDDVAVVEMQHGRANALDFEFCEAIVAKLDELRQSARAIVWTGNGSIFSAGVDLKRVLEEDKGYLHAFLPALSRAFKALYAFPNPMVCAINGHALAGGCIIAVAGDRRIMAEKQGTIGTPELRVGVPFPSMALEMVRQVCGAHADRVLLRGERHDPKTAKKLGLVDELVPADELLDAAFAAAQDLATINTDIFAVTKWQLREQVFLRLHELEDEEREVERLWLDPATLDRVRAYVENTLGS